MTDDPFFNMKMQHNALSNFKVPHGASSESQAKFLKIGASCGVTDAATLPFMIDVVLLQNDSSIDIASIYCAYILCNICMNAMLAGCSLTSAGQAHIRHYTHKCIAGYMQCCANFCRVNAASVMAVLILM